MTAPPAAAQTASLGSDGGATNAPAWLSLSSPPQLTWGGFDLHPHLRDLVVYDNNISYVPKNQEAAMADDLAVGLRITGGDRAALQSYADLWYPVSPRELTTAYLVTVPSDTWPEKFMVLNYDSQWQMFARYTDNNSWDQLVSAIAEWPMARVVTGLMEDYTDQKTLMVAGATRTEVRQDRTEVNAGYQFSDDLSLNGAFNFQSSAYPEDPNLSGYTEGKFSLSLNRQIDALFNASLTAATGLDNVETGANQQFVDIGARVRYVYSELFSLDASAGEEYRHFDSVINPVLKPYCAVQANYLPGGRTVVQLTLLRQQFPSLYNNYYYMGTGGDFTVHEYLTARLSLRSDLEYYMFDSMPTTKVVGVRQSPDYYSVRLAGDWRFYESLYAELFYQFRGAGISENFNVVHENIVGLQMELYF